MFLILLYVIFATWYLFEGTLHKKMMHLFMFYCILLITELSIVGGYALLYPEEMDGVLDNSISNTIFGCLAKILQGLFCYCFLGKNKAVKFFCQNKERLSLILMCYIMLSNLYLKRIVYKGNSNTTLLLETVFLFWYILSSLLALKGKNKHIWELKQKVDSNLDVKRQISDIDQFRHDFSINVFLMKNLAYCKEYDKLEHYMAFANVEKVKLSFKHPNFPVRILVSSLIHTAASAGITFAHLERVQ